MELLDTVVLCLNNYLCNELTEIIYSYLVLFNTGILSSEKIYEKTRGIFIDKICFCNNKIYFSIYSTGLIIIYDIKKKETLELRTELSYINSFCNIDDNSIIIATQFDLHIYEFNILDGKINIIFKEIYTYFDKILDVYYYNNIIYFIGHFETCVYDRKKRKHEKLYGGNFSDNVIFLYNGYLYIFDWDTYKIKKININNKKDEKIIELSSKYFNYDKLRVIDIFVDEIQIYIRSFKNIYVFDYCGDFIGRIKTGENNLRSSSIIHKNQIYWIEEIKKHIYLLKYKQKYKFEIFRKRTSTN